MECIKYQYEASEKHVFFNGGGWRDNLMFAAPNSVRVAREDICMDNDGADKALVNY